MADGGLPLAALGSLNGSTVATLAAVAFLVVAFAYWVLKT
jgi:hypothetical protein